VPGYLVLDQDTNTKKDRDTMTIEKNHAGAWIVSDIIGGYRVARQYYGYTKREAVQLFKQQTRAGV
jgi:hypothetical protein